MKEIPLRLFGAALVLTCCLSKSFAAFPTVALKPVVLQQIHSPTTIAYAPDGSGRIFVCDQLGKIYIIQGGMMLPTPFLNIASSANVLVADQGPGPVIMMGTGYDERGLLGLAFHPGFANPISPGYRKFYINYIKTYAAGTDPTPPGGADPVNSVTVIDEFQVSPGNPNLALLASQRRVLAFTQPQSNHNGGQVEFGPDGLLYIGTGDGGSSNDNNAGHTDGTAIVPRPTNNLGNGQDKTRFLGKILRIDPIDPDGGGPLTYAIPASNPFVGAGGGVKEEIYAFGLRNPWRFSFDKRAGGTNRIFCGDVGQGRIEEINLIISGGNYGWRYLEGHEFPAFSSGSGTNPMLDPGTGPYIAPIASYAHPGITTAPPVLPQLGLSVTGGFVYRGAAIPALQGKYIFGDYGSTAGASDGRIMGLEETAPLSGVFTLTQAVPFINSSNPVIGQRILCLGEDEAGEIYIGMKSNAGVLQLSGGLPAGGIYKVVPLASISTTLAANKDNTIFSEDIDLTRDYSDGLGYLYAGRTGPNFGPYNRRALVSFDVASALPAGAMIQSAQLKLFVNRAGPGSMVTTPFALHRLTQTWGEGTSNNPLNQGYGAPATANDATWNYRFYNTTPWSTPGGTYNAGPSASTTFGGGGLITWESNALLTADVQGWLDTPAGNAGWIVLGDENNPTTACRFDSKNIGATPPALLLNYLGAPLPTYFESWLETYSLATPVGKYVDPKGDIEGDAIFNLIEYAFGLSPLDPDAPESGLQIASAPSGPNTVYTYTFPRDPLATDLTYNLQATSDLTGIWTTITTSVAGGVPTGTGFVSESDLGPVMEVTAQEILPAGSRRFVRLQIIQQ